MNSPVMLSEEIVVQEPLRDVARSTFNGMEPVFVHLNLNLFETRLDGPAWGLRTWVGRPPKVAPQPVVPGK